MRYLLFFPLLLLIGCNDSSHQRPYVIDNTPEKKVERTLMNVHTPDEIKLATIESQTKKELAEIERKKALEIEAIRREVETKKIEAEKEIAMQKEAISSQKLLQEKEKSNNYALIILFIFIASLLTLIYFLRKRREDKLKMHEEELNLKEKELQVKIAEKMLDTLSSGNLTPNEEQRMLEIFEKRSKEFPKIGKH